jgi:hypothetical protein
MIFKIRLSLRADSTVPPCLGDKVPIPPNDCRDCRRHSDFTCRDVRVVKVPKGVKEVYLVTEE